MNFLELVKDRYSCRAYQSLDVEKEQFGLPVNEEPAVIIPLGYAADEMKPKSRKAIDEIVK